MDIILGLAVLLVPLLVVLTVLATLGWLGLARPRARGLARDAAPAPHAMGGAARVISPPGVQRSARCTSEPSPLWMAFFMAS